MKLNQSIDESRPSGSDQARSSQAKASSRKAGLLALSLLVTLLTAQLGLADQEAILGTGERLEAAALTACEFSEASQAATLTVSDTPRETTDLVRWGEPAGVDRRPAVVLTDGSRLLSDREWSPIGLVRISEDSVRLRRGKGWADFPRDAVRWAVLDAEAAGLSLESLPTEAGGEEQDLVLLAEGDRLLGRVVELKSDKLTIDVGGSLIEAPLESVAAVRLTGAPSDREAVCLVGWGDGSLVQATRLQIADGSVRVQVAGVEFESNTDSLSFVQPLNGPVRYLSDLEPIDYRHTPYLDLAWPYTRDTNLRGGLLAGGGSRRAKGLAMHSAARLVYRLDGSSQRFRAEVAVGNTPAGSAAVGSVVFRVYFVKDGAFVPAYDSGVVRGGDPALPIDLDASDAVAIALVIDYADNGDAGDEALWLDARLVDAG